MKIEIFIPENLSEIKLSQYKKYTNLDFEADQDFLMRKTLDIFCGVKDVLKVRYKDLKRVNLAIENCLSQDVKLQNTFIYKDVEYGLIPNLSEITFGEFIDLDTYFNWEQMEKAMSVLYRPVVKRVKDFYEIEEYNGSHSDFLDLPMDIVQGVVVFFWSLASKLSLHFLQSSAEEKQIPLAQDTNSAGNGDGLAALTHSLVEILPSTKPSALYPFRNVLTN